jgi:propionyl-CoA synthetase
MDEDGYVFVMARTDDVINVAGHRLSTGAIEEVISGHPAVAECAVFGLADALKTEVPIGLFVVKDGIETDPSETERQLIELVRAKIGAVTSFKTAIQVERLPKNRAGKILRGTIRSIANATPWKTPAAIDEPEVLGEIEAALKGRSIIRPAARHPA